MSSVHSSIARGNHQFYPQYYSYHAQEFSYVFKIQNASSIVLKIYDTFQKCIEKQSLQVEQLGKDYVDRISTEKDLSTVLEHLVKIGTLSRERFPISSKVNQIQKLTQAREWGQAEKVALTGLEQANGSEKMAYYHLLEEIYEHLNSKNLEQLWISLSEEYIKLSQLSDAEKACEKAYKQSNSFNSACHLARVFNLQKKNKESVQTYYEAATIALFSEQLDKVSHCVEEIRKVDPQMEELDNNKKMFLFVLVQLAKISETLSSQQQSLLNFLALAPAQHQANLLDSVLHNAVTQGRVDIVEMVMQHWDLVPINKCFGHETLVATATQKGNEEMVRALIAHPDIHIGCPQQSGHRLTPLALAEQAGFKRIVTLLYQHSQSLEQDLLAFKNRPLGSVEYLHVHIYSGSNQTCLVVTGIDSKDHKQLLHLSYPLKQPLQQELEQLVKRGMKGVKYIIINSPNRQGIRSSPAFFPDAQIYEAQISNREGSHSPDGEKLKAQFGDKIGRLYEELSEKINHFVQGACVPSFSEAVVYRALALRGKAYFEDDNSSLGNDFS